MYEIHYIRFFRTVNMIGGIQVIMVNVGVTFLKNEMCKSSLLLTEDITLKLLVTKNLTILIDGSVRHHLVF